MIRVVEYLSLFLWIIYFFLAIYREVRSNKENIKEVLKKPFYFFRIDNIFFLIVYLFYNNFARFEVIPYLYLVIVITNIVYLSYDLVDNYKFSKIKKQEYLSFFLGFLVVLILGAYLFVSNNTLFVSKITLWINIFIPIFVSLVKFLKKH